MPATQNTWFRIREALPNNPIVHKVVLAYASDLNLLTTATVTSRHIFLTAGCQTRLS